MTLCLKNISNNVFGIISLWVMEINYNNVTRDSDGRTGNSVVGGTCAAMKWYSVIRQRIWVSCKCVIKTEMTSLTEFLFC